MADIKSKEARSQNMAKIKSKDTKPEMWFRKQLFAKGFRYRKNVNYIFGHPDLWLAKYHTAIFIHGCFWHRHPNCKYAYLPKSRVGFWKEKFHKNRTRDELVKNTLFDTNIRVLIVWECKVKQMQKDHDFAEDILSKISSFFKQRF